MSNLKKIQKPKINANLDIISTLDELLQLIEDDEKIYDKLIENMDISNLDESRVSFDSCIFRNVTFDNCTFRYIDLLDVSFEKCDLSKEKILIIAAIGDTVGPNKLHHEPLMKEIYKYSKENVKEILIHADHSYNNKKILLSKIVAQYIESIYNE